MIEPNLIEINRLFQNNNLDIVIDKFQVMNGTTNGIVMKLEAEKGMKYVLKFDRPYEINLAVKFLEAYHDSQLLPQIVFVSPDESYFIYISRWYDALQSWK